MSKEAELVSDICSRFPDHPPVHCTYMNELEVDMKGRENLAHHL